MTAEQNMKPGIVPSPRKLVALANLGGLSAKLSDGADYDLQNSIIAGVTLDRVRQDLAGIRGSLADAVLDERTH